MPMKPSRVDRDAVRPACPPTFGNVVRLISGEMSRGAADEVAQAARQETGASHALAVLIEVDDGPDRIDFDGSIDLAIASTEGVESPGSRIYGRRDWVRLGAVELGLDCLRRHLQGLPVTERTDFEPA